MRKRILLIGLLGALLCATNMKAQEEVAVEVEMTAAEKKAVKMAEKEAKRAAKEEEDAEKEMEKMEKAEVKAERKQAKRDKNQAKFDAFMENWQPVDVSGIDAKKMPGTINFFKQSNALFAKMKEVEDYVDYIQVEALPENEEGVVEMKVTNKKTGEDIAKSDATEIWTKAILDLTNAGFTAATVALSGTSAMTEFISNPLEVLTLGKKVKNTLSAVQYSIIAIPLIKAKIQDNKAAVEQSKNN